MVCSTRARRFRNRRQFRSRAMRPSGPRRGEWMCGFPRWPPSPIGRGVRGAYDRGSPCRRWCRCGSPACLADGDDPPVAGPADDPRVHAAPVVLRLSGAGLGVDGDEGALDAPRFPAVGRWRTQKVGGVRCGPVDDAVDGRAGNPERRGALLQGRVRAVGRDRKQDPVGEPERPAAASAGVRAGCPELPDEPVALPAGGPGPGNEVNWRAAGEPWAYERSLLSRSTALANRAHVRLESPRAAAD
jgi:hypothetical protein